MHRDSRQCDAALQLGPSTWRKAFGDRPRAGEEWVIDEAVRGRSPKACRPHFDSELLDLDLYVHAGRQVELHQRVHRLVGRVDDCLLYTSDAADE